MSKETEKVMKQLTAFLEANAGEDPSDEKLDMLIGQFMTQHNANIAMGTSSDSPETADDYLDLAREATSKKKRLEYVNKALELEPDNLDAGLAKANLSAKNQNDLLISLSDLLKQGETWLQEEGYFDIECIGHFWGILETRPYMRIRAQYIDTLIDCGMMRKAVSECERTLELCEGDNLGIRYQLMHLYAYLEDEKSAHALHQRFDDYEETQMLMPLAVLYYKLNRLDDSLGYLKRLVKENKDTKKFIGAVKRQTIEKYYAEVSPYGYRPNTMDELLEELKNNYFLFDSAVYFFEWAEKALQKAK